MPPTLPAAKVACLDIDLAGVERCDTGIAMVRGGCLQLVATASTDADILDFARQAGPSATLAINAPLILPRGTAALTTTALVDMILAPAVASLSAFSRACAFPPWRSRC